MINAINKDIFYVSNLGTDKVSIIDGESLSIIEEIQVGPRPYEIDIDDKNNIYIATDRNNKITIINNVTKESTSLDIPNNGHLKVDSISKKIYVSNTEEIYIYSLEENIIINKLSGFIAVDCIELNSNGSKLFTLDILKNEINIYDTETLKLIQSYKDICEAPSNFFVGNTDRYLYITNRGIGKLDLNGNLVKIDINNNDISYIDFQKGSIITAISGDSSLLYVVNSGLNRIEIVDILKDSIVGILKTSLSNPQKTKVLKENKLLLATSRDIEGRGALDVIDIDSKKILNTLKFKEKYSSPYNIEIIKKNIFKEIKFIKNIDSKKSEDKGNLIFANKVVSTYEEKIIFNQESIELIYEDKIDIVEVRFENCQVIEESKNKEFIINNEDYIVLNFDFIIPYYISCINSKKEKLTIKGNLSGKERAIVYISQNGSDNVEFVIKSDTKSMYSPYIKDNYIIFDASSIISTYVIKEELIFIPSTEENKKLKEV